MVWTRLLFLTAPLLTQCVSAAYLQQQTLSDLSFCSNATNACLLSVRSNENAPANCKACLVVTETATPTLTLYKTLHTKHFVDPADAVLSTFTATEEITPTITATETRTLTAMPDLRIREVEGAEAMFGGFEEFSAPRCPPKYAAEECEYEEYEAACACIGAGVETRTISGYPETVTIMTTEAALEEGDWEEATMVGGWADVERTAVPTVTLTLTASSTVTKTILETVWVKARKQ